MTPRPLLARIGAHLSVAGGVHTAIARATDLHMSAVQVFTRNNRQWRARPLAPDSIRQWRAQFAASGLQAAVSHASYLINLAAQEKDVQRQSRAALQDELLRAHSLGIPFVVLHPGAHKGAGPEAGIQRIAAAVNDVYAAHPRLADTQLLFEIMAGQGTVIGRSTDELGQLVRQTSARAHVGVCLDSCHAFAAGYDLRTQPGYEAFLRACDQAFGLDAVRCWHLNDSQGALGSHRDRHQHVGEGELGAAPFRFILNDPRWFDRPLLLETPKTIARASDLRNMQVLGSLIADPRRIPPGLMEEPRPAAA